MSTVVYIICEYSDKSNWAYFDVKYTLYDKQAAIDMATELAEKSLPSKEQFVESYNEQYYTIADQLRHEKAELSKCLEQPNVDHDYVLDIERSIESLERSLVQVQDAIDTGPTIITSHTSCNTLNDNVNDNVNDNINDSDTNSITSDSIIDSDCGDHGTFVVPKKAIFFASYNYIHYCVIESYIR